jgi:hypothetical protein
MIRLKTICETVLKGSLGHQLEFSDVWKQTASSYFSMVWLASLRRLLTGCCTFVLWVGSCHLLPSLRFPSAGTDSAEKFYLRSVPQGCSWNKEPETGHAAKCSTGDQVLAINIKSHRYLHQC